MDRSKLLVAGTALISLAALWKMSRPSAAQAQESQKAIRALAKAVAVDLRENGSEYDRDQLARFQQMAHIPPSGEYDALTRAALAVYGVPEAQLPPPYFGPNTAVDYYTGLPMDVPEEECDPAVANGEPLDLSFLADPDPAGAEAPASDVLQQPPTVVAAQQNATQPAASVSGSGGFGLGEFINWASQSTEPAGQAASAPATAPSP